MPRPTKLDNITVKKLEDAFVLGATVKEACFNANISKQTYYNWIGENPELLDRFEILQQSPVLKARKCVVKEIEHNPTLAMRYLEKKLKTEFPESKESELDNNSALLNQLLSKFEEPS